MSRGQSTPSSSRKSSEPEMCESDAMGSLIFIPRNIRQIKLNEANEPLYRVSWFDTWEPEECLEDCGDLLDEFHMIEADRTSAAAMDNFLKVVDEFCGSEVVAGSKSDVVHADELLTTAKAFSLSSRSNKLSSISINDASHAGETTFICFQCNANFADLDNLARHINATHKHISKPKEWRDPLTCIICGIKHKAKEAFQQHMQKHLVEIDGRQVQRKCADCDYVNKNIDALKRHVAKEHVGEQLHTCDICGHKAWIHRDLLKHRRLTHKDIATTTNAVVQPSAMTPVRIVLDSTTLGLPQSLSTPTGDDEDESDVDIDRSSQALIDISVGDADASIGAIAEEDLLSMLEKISDETTEIALNADSSEQGSQRKYQNDDGLVCELCGKRFSSRSHVTRHIKNVHHRMGKHMWKCKVCGASFSNHPTAKRHLKTHLTSDFSPSKCPYCAFSVKGEAALQAHVTTVHKKEKAYLCDTCGLDFWTQKELLVHESLVHHSQPSNFSPAKSTVSMDQKKSKQRFACTQPNCEKMFYSSAALKSHLMKHGRDAPFVCSHCGLRYATKSALRRHDYSCTSKPPASEPSSLTESSAMVFEETVIENDQVDVPDFTIEEEVVEVCDESEAAFDEYQFVDEERSKKPLVDGTPKKKRGRKPMIVQCEHCEFSGSKGDVAKHERTHRANVTYTIEEPEPERYSCEHCSKSYLHKNGLRRHMLEIHKDIVRPGPKLELKCKICGMTCTDRQSLKQHQAELHLDDKRVTSKRCPHCDFIAISKNNVLLERHIAHEHVREKTHECEVCEQRFWVRKDLLRHVKVCKGVKQAVTKIKLPSPRLKKITQGPGPRIDAAKKIDRSPSNSDGNASPLAPSPAYNEDEMIVNDETQAASDTESDASSSSTSTASSSISSTSGNEQEAGNASSDSWE